jgi:hypothetical protein
LIRSSRKEQDTKESTTRLSIKGAAFRAHLASRGGSSDKVGLCLLIFSKANSMQEESKLKQYLIDNSPSFHNGLGVTQPAPYQRNMRRWAEKHGTDRYVTPGAPVSKACYDEFYLHPQVFSPSRDDLIRNSRERSHLSLKPSVSPAEVIDATRKVSLC